MKEKIELLKECTKLMEIPKISSWYDKHLATKPQVETINSLVKGVASGELLVREALSIALIVGVQWSVKFSDTP